MPLYRVTRQLGRLNYEPFGIDDSEKPHDLGFRPNFNAEAEAEIRQLWADNQEIPVGAGFSNSQEAQVVRCGEPGWWEAFERILWDHGYETEPIETA